MVRRAINLTQYFNSENIVFLPNVDEAAFNVAFDIVFGGRDIEGRYFMTT